MRFYVKMCVLLNITNIILYFFFEKMFYILLIAFNNSIMVRGDYIE